MNLLTGLLRVNTGTAQPIAQYFREFASTVIDDAEHLPDICLGTNGGNVASQIACHSAAVGIEWQYDFSRQIVSGKP